MTIGNTLSENRLAVIGIVLGLLAIVLDLFLLGPIDSFTYVGIPAITIGVISLVRTMKQHGRRRFASILLPLIGIFLGLLPVIYYFAMSSL